MFRLRTLKLVRRGATLPRGVPRPSELFNKLATLAAVSPALCLLSSLYALPFPFGKEEDSLLDSLPEHLAKPGSRAAHEATRVKNT